MGNKQCKKCGATYLNYISALECCDEIEIKENEKTNKKISKKSTVCE